MREVRAVIASLGLIVNLLPDMTQYAIEGQRCVLRDRILLVMEEGADCV